jgi:hypothetical protein
LSDTSDRRSAGPLTLVVRAVFVPEGEQPPPEFSSVFNTIKFAATLDPETGVITCDNAGVSFDGDVRAEWHPDEEQGGDGGEQAGDQGRDERGTGQPDAQNKMNSDRGGRTSTTAARTSPSAGQSRTAGLQTAGDNSRDDQSVSGGNIELAAAGDLKCQGHAGGCQTGGSWGTTGMYSIGGRTLCPNCAIRMLGGENETADEKLKMLSPFTIEGQ